MPGGGFFMNREMYWRYTYIFGFADIPTSTVVFRTPSLPRKMLKQSTARTIRLTKE